MIQKTHKNNVERRVIPRDEHNISRENISNAALKVLYRLKDAGYQAYLVGGSVRDLLLGQHPKDFDIATDATPEQVRSLFNNSRLIGRRFRLAHVRFGKEIIEVATFRAPASEDDDDHAVAEGSGRVLRDNVWGSFEDDVWRRDFTANALYYDIRDFSIRDYVGGVEDIRNRQLRLIGDPEQRYREDPVRMLRAARFAAKLGFDIEPGTRAPIPELAQLLDNIPAARLFDEFGKLFQAGHAMRTWELLAELNLLHQLFPWTVRWLASSPDADTEQRRRNFISKALTNTDQRVAEDKPVTPMFLFAVFLWGTVKEGADHYMEHAGMSEVQALVAAASEAASAQAAIIAVPKRFSYPMREIMQIQPRFEKRTGKRAASLLEHRRFRAAYDLLVLRQELGEVDSELVQFWTDIQEQPEHKRTLEMAGMRPDAGPRPKRRRRRRSHRG